MKDSPQRVSWHWKSLYCCKLQFCVRVCYNQRAILQRALLVFRDKTIISHKNKKEKYMNACRNRCVLLFCVCKYDPTTLVGLDSGQWLWATPTWAMKIDQHSLLRSELILCVCNCYCYTLQDNTAGCVLVNQWNYLQGMRIMLLWCNTRQSEALCWKIPILKASSGQGKVDSNNHGKKGGKVKK